MAKKASAAAVSDAMSDPSLMMKAAATVNQVKEAVKDDDEPVVQVAE